MKITLYNDTTDLSTYSADDLHYWIMDLVADIEYACCHDREKDYDNAHEALVQSLEYILWERK